MGWGMLSPMYGQDRHFELNETYDIPIGGVLRLRSNDATVTIRGSERADVLVRMQRDISFSQRRQAEAYYFSLEVNASSEGLTIQEQKGSDRNYNFTWLKRDSYTIELEVPRGINLNLVGDDDDYAIVNVNGSISLRAEDGDVAIADCHGDKFDIELDDGTLNMRGGNGKLEFVGEDGDFTFDAGNFSSVDARIDDGDLRIETPLMRDGQYRFTLSDGALNLRLTSGGGEFDIRRDDGSLRFSRGFELRLDEEAHKVMVFPGGNAAVSIRTEDGDIRIYHEQGGSSMNY